jgi:hypothetical protein
MNNNSKYDLDKLIVLLNNNIDRFGKKKRFIHPNTVGNFIYHFKFIKDSKRKDHIYSNLSKYLDFLSSLSVQDVGAKESAEFFDRFIYPIVNYYDVHLGFSVHTRWHLFLLAPIAISILAFIESNIYYQIGTGVIGGFFFIKNIYKTAIYKTYGLFH